MTEIAADRGRLTADHRGGGQEERIARALAGRPALGRAVDEQPGLSAGGVRPAVRHPDGQQRVVAGAQLVLVTVDVQDRIPGQDVDGRLEGMQVQARPAAWLELADG
jgi:hypothetical protein